MTAVQSAAESACAACRAAARDIIDQKLLAHVRAVRRKLKNCSKGTEGIVVSFSKRRF